MLSTFFQVNGVEKNKDTTPPFPDSGIGRRSYIYETPWHNQSVFTQTRKTETSLSVSWGSVDEAANYNIPGFFFCLSAEVSFIWIYHRSRTRQIATPRTGGGSWLTVRLGNGLRRRPCRTIRDLTPCGIISSAQPRRCGFLNGKNGLCK
jgi:hypothetical protein